ncbi:hypothetical protein BDV97DRAFT_298472 [Delphinella strobiligena]|nr:hypothetical protein BDV97DRAFT_298472 [Delphinella strobiligena]
MSDEFKSRGLQGIKSLRKKKNVARPKISAPQQILTNNHGNGSTTSLNAPSTSINAPSPSPSPTQLAPPSPSLQLRTPNWASSHQNVSDSNLSIPIPIPIPIPSPTPRPRPSINGTDRTADLVKRRYSTRFAQPQDDGLTPPIPGVPRLPAQYAASARSSRSGRSPERAPGQRIRVDVKALRDPALMPDKYVARALADATDDDIYAFQSDLQALKARTNTDLQHNVYQNRTQFIKISQEADKLKTEMRTLRTLMSELTGVLGHAASAGRASEFEADSVAERKRSNRSSVANLEALWSTHLQALWKRVEASQKYLPAVPGRHIVHESGRWVELNSATWKPRRRVHLILLNDHLLFASEKKRLDPSAVSPNPQSRRQSAYVPPAQTQTHLVAERCWPLQDVHMADISTRAGDPYARSDKSAISNALSVRVGKESWTFAAPGGQDSSTETSALLIAFRKAVEDLRKTTAAQHSDKERALDELAFLTGDSRLLKKANVTEGIDAGVTNSAATLIDVDGKQQSLRWVENQIDGLDIDIALQRFDDAVSRTDKLRKLARNIKGNAPAQEIIGLKLDQRAAKLATLLARRLRDSNSGASVVKETVGWLVKLGYEEMARTGYLNARKEVLRKRTRQLPFTGSLPPHLTAFAFVTFTIILNTFRTFSSSFPPASASAVVKWAKERIDDFNESLERQLSSVERGSPLWNDCIDVVQHQSEVLREVAVDFSGLIAKGLAVEQEQEQEQHLLPAELAIRSRGDPVGLGLSNP